MSKGIASKYVEDLSGPCPFCGNPQNGFSHHPDTCIENLCARAESVEARERQLRQALDREREYLHDTCLDCDATCSRDEKTAYCGCENPKRIRLIVEALSTPPAPSAPTVETLSLGQVKFKACDHKTKRTFDVHELELHRLSGDITMIRGYGDSDKDGVTVYGGGQRSYCGKDRYELLIEVKNCLNKSTSPTPCPRREAMAGALSETKARLSAAYEEMNYYASGESMKEHARVEPQGILAEVYRILAPLPKLIDAALTATPPASEAKHAGRLTKRVGVGEAVPVDETVDICLPFVKAGWCKTGVMLHSNGKYGYQRHCNDECVLGKLIDRLAYFEDEAQPKPAAPACRCGEYREALDNAQKVLRAIWVSDDFGIAKRAARVKAEEIAAALAGGGEHARRTDAGTESGD